MDTQESSSGGLWKRQSSVATDDTITPPSTAGISPSPAEIQMGSVAAPLLSNNNSSTSGKDNEVNDTLSKEENIQMYGHVALSFLFLMTASSIVPFFASAEDEAWRSKNIPYQKTAAGDVILDFELNHPLVDPPTVTCK